MDKQNNIALIQEAKSETTSGDRLKEIATLNDELAKIVANNVIAPPELLEELSKSKSKAVTKVVAGNPNTPIETLFKLGEYFPQELLTNPVFELLYLEQINFIQEIPENTLYSLLQQENTPDFLFKSAINHQDDRVQEILKLHIKSSEEIENYHDFAAQVIKEFSDTSTFSGLIRKHDYYLLEFCLKYISPKILSNRDMRIFLARTSNTLSMIEKLADDEDYEVRVGVTKNLFAPTNILKKLAHDKNNAVLVSLIEHPNAPISLLERFSTHPSSNIRCRIARNKSITLSLQKQLSKDPHISVLQEIAQNPSTSIDILEQLDKNPHIFINIGLAKNPNTPVNILKQLANSGDSPTLHGVAENPNTPIDILEKLVMEQNGSAFYSVAKNPNAPSEILEQLAILKIDYTIKQNIAINPNTPVKILEQLAVDKDSLVRDFVVRNPNTPIAILEQLATDKHPGVCRFVATNPNTPIEILKQLANHQTDFVRADVLKNPQCTSPEFKQVVFKNVAKSKTPSFSRVALFLSDYAESSVLAENSNSISWLERYAIAQNPKTPTYSLKQLAKDGNRIVRATAKETLQKHQ
ncbi:MAG: hypothetical protein AAF383_09595 [Cyanobacteria bacterium P01_A01_bin.83]